MASYKVLTRVTRRNMPEDVIFIHEILLKFQQSLNNIDVV
jgi:hypothetical protein